MKPNPLDLAQGRSTDLLSCDPDTLVDLRDVRIDGSLPLRERANGFLHQVRNPYLFKVDGLIVKAVYPSDAKMRLCDAVSALLAP